MKARNEGQVPAPTLSPWALICGVASALVAMACTGVISDQGKSPGAGPTGGATGAGPVVLPRVNGDVGRVSIHRLNNLEYDNTMRDLLGVDGMAQKTFQPDEEGEFDNDADAFTMNDARYEQYFNSADAIGETVFMDTAAAGLRQTYVYGLVSPPCAPSATDTTCSQEVIAAFAQKAWRRPPTPAEVSGLVKLATDALALGETADDSIKQVVKTLLASTQFLYRVEYDANPASLTAHALDPYELATRLAYLGWSTMPDKTLFDLAAAGQLETDASLTAQIDRMLADPKGANFTNSFAGQWLGVRDMQAHQVEPSAFPMFDESLRAALVQEELLYFDEFLTGPLPMTAFFTTKENFVNARLAQHYGFPAVGATAGFERVMNGSPNRVGFLGLGSFLTFTSYSYRTAPTLRGKWVLLNLLCQTIPNPPAMVPKLDATALPTDANAQQEDVRMRLTQHRAAAECSSCHALLDPIGLGLENFDAVGAYRTKYAPTSPTPIDASGMLPSGETFSSLGQLAAILSTGPRAQQLTDCASKKMMTYALSRSLTAADDPYLNQVRASWAGQGWGLKALLKNIVVSDPFRFRRGEAP
jgi:hypothetical protein